MRWNGGGGERIEADGAVGKGAAGVLRRRGGKGGGEEVGFGFVEGLLLVALEVVPGLGEVVGMWEHICDSLY